MSSIIKLNNVNMWYDRGENHRKFLRYKMLIWKLKRRICRFFGPSGCGKTTLLYAISGIEQAQEGEILINNRDISKFSKRIGDLPPSRSWNSFQQFNLIPSLTVFEQCCFANGILGISKDKENKNL